MSYKFVSLIDVNWRWLKHRMLNNMFHSCEVWYALGESKIYSAIPYFSKSKLCRNNWNSQATFSVLLYVNTRAAIAFELILTQMMIDERLLLGVMCLNIRADTKVITAAVGRSLTFLHVTTYCAITKFPETVYRYYTRVIKVMRRLRARKWVELRVFYCFNHSFLLLFLLVTENRLLKKN